MRRRDRFEHVGRPRGALERRQNDQNVETTETTTVVLSQHHLNGVPVGYRTMDDHEAVKVFVKPHA